MGRSDKNAWLAPDAGDLKEVDVEDVPVPGQSVRVRALPAAYSNQASSEALEYKTVGRDQVATVNKARLEVLQFAHGVIEPQFTVEEAEQISQKFGPAFAKVIAKIDEISGVDKEALDNATARFQGERASANGADVGDGAPDGSGGPHVPARAGSGAR